MWLTRGLRAYAAMESDRTGLADFTAAISACGPRAIRFDCDRTTRAEARTYVGKAWP